LEHCREGVTILAISCRKKPRYILKACSDAPEKLRLERLEQPPVELIIPAKGGGDSQQRMLVIR
jgi:hypothetical protein